MDIHYSVVKYMGCREINCSSKGCKACHPHTPCQTLMLVGLLLMLSPFSSVFKYAVPEELHKWPTMSTLPSCGSFVEKAETGCVWDKTPSDLLPKKPSL